MAQVEADRAGVIVADDRLDAADHRRAESERNDRDFRSRRPVEQCGDVGFVPGEGDEIGRIGEIAIEGAHGLREGLAISMEKPLVGLLREDIRERGGGANARRAERDVGDLRRRRCGARLGAELFADEAEEARAFGLVEALALVSPAVEFESCAHTIPIFRSGRRNLIA